MTFELFCPRCNRWLRNTRFAPKRKTDHGTVVQFHPQALSVAAHVDIQLALRGETP